MKRLVAKIIKLRKRYKLAVKVKNVVLKVLNLAATGYSIFVIVEPFLNKKSGESESLDAWALNFWTFKYWFLGHSLFVGGLFIFSKRLKNLKT